MAVPVHRIPAGGWSRLPRPDRRRPPTSAAVRKCARGEARIVPAALAEKELQITFVGHASFLIGRRAT